jgi:WS/DGAT/MGAT family acyltransferase
MAYTHYDRLSALDATFVEIESDSVHMHVAAVALFEAGPLRDGEGALDMERIRAAVESALCHTPRFRQKLDRIPLFEHPVWVDDPRFNLGYHVRHSALPHPGDERLLKRLAGRILSQKLDRGKPLWEMWFVEGVEGDRVAVIAKAHHCMVDGISGLDLLAHMMRLEPDPTFEPAPPWHPRPAPVSAQLFADELWRRASYPLAVLRDTASSLARPRELVSKIWERAAAFEEVVQSGLRPTSPTPLNPEIGPYRRFDWTHQDLASIRSVGRQLGGTLNDVVLAAAAGAIGSFLRRRGVAVEDLSFRAQVPVNTRSRDERGVGNRVVMLMADLPVGEPDPLERLVRVGETMTRLKRSRLRAGIEFLEDLSDHTATSLWVEFARIATRQRSFNVVITNIPGPADPVYLLGARMEGIYPLVPLAQNQALGIALFSYDGGLHWGLHADWDALPDLHDLALGIDAEMERFVKLAAERADA